MRIFGAGLIVSVLWVWVFNVISWIVYGDMIYFNNIEGYVFVGAAFISGAVSQTIKQIGGINYGLL